MEDGSEWPLEFASRSLSIAEKKYAQMEKEGLAIIFDINRFQLYLYRRKFVLVIDHQPLKSSVPPLAPARLQRWGALLRGYDFDIILKNSSDNASADFFQSISTVISG